MNTPCLGRTVSQNTIFSLIDLTSVEVGLKYNYSPKIRFYRCKVVFVLICGVSHIFRSFFYSAEL